MDCILVSAQPERQFVWSSHPSPTEVAIPTTGISQRMTSLEHGFNLDTYLGQTVRTLWENAPQLLRSALLFNLVGLRAFAFFALGWLVPALVAAVVTVGPDWSALLA